MVDYTSVFGTATVPPSGPTYRAVSLTANTSFYWPESPTTSDTIAAIMDVTPTGAYTMSMPAANTVSKGRDILIRNLGASTITVKDTGGNTLTTITAGSVKYLYLTDSSTANGVWASFTFGVGSGGADASALAGHGLVASASTLVQSATTAAKSAAYTVVTSDRASTISFSSSGALTCTLTGASGYENGFFVYITNQGTGNVTIDGDGSETIDGALTATLSPAESLMLVCTGTAWVTIGYGRSTNFQFTKLVFDVSSGTPFTLTAVQAQNKLIQFTGTLTAAATVNIPAVVAIYYIQAAWAGAYSVTFKTTAGTGVGIALGENVIAYCDGVNVTLAQTASLPAATLSGGAAGQILYQSGSGTTAFSAAGTSGQVLVSGGTGAPTWSSGVVTLDTAQTFITQPKTFTNSLLKILGSSTGVNTFTCANAGASSYVTTFPAVTGTVTLLENVQTFTKTQTAAVTALTSSAASIAIDLALSNNFSHTMTENTTLAAPTNAVAGTSGQIAFTQHASAAKTLAFNAAWISTDGTTPTISTTVGTVNLLTYYVVDSTHVWFALAKHGVT